MAPGRAYGAGWGPGFGSGQPGVGPRGQGGPERGAPTDFIGQLGACFARNPATALERLGLLAGRYPHVPSIRAHLLVHAVRAGVTLPVLGRFDATVPIRPRGPDDPVDDADDPFLRTAAEGERLDPDNAFFPMMSAIALIARGRDRAAVAALGRAASLSRWDDYEQERRAARRRTAELAFGELTTAQRLVWDERGSSYDLNLATAAARVAVSEAARAEEQGDASEGWRIRRCVMRCGSLMRSQASAYRSAAAGAEMVVVATGDPDTVGIVGNPASRPAAAARAAALQLLELRLERAGLHDDARWVRTELAACEVVLLVGARTGHRRGITYWHLPFMLRDHVWRYGTAWLLALGVLVNAAWLLVAGAVTVWVARHRLERRTAVLTVATAAGVLGCGVVACLSRDVLIRVMMSAASPEQWGITPPGLALVATYTAAVLALPGIVILRLGTVRPAHAPRLERLGRGMLSAGALALCLYALPAVATAGRSTGLERSLDRFLAAEGPYLAARTGTRWPGATPFGME